MHRPYLEHRYLTLPHVTLPYYLASMVTIPYIRVSGVYRRYDTMLASLPMLPNNDNRVIASERRERNKRDKKKVLVRYLPMNNLNKELVQTLQIASWHLLLFMCDGAPARPRKGSAGATNSPFFGDSFKHHHHANHHHSLSAFTEERTNAVIQRPYIYKYHTIESKVDSDRVIFSDE